MKISFFFLLALVGVAHATPRVLSLTQVALQKLDADIMPDHYDVAIVELNNDGNQDVIALMNGKSSYCGSGGSTMFVLIGKDGGFDSIGSIKVVNRPIYLRKNVTKGMRDLLVAVRGGGATPGLAVLTFDGISYPAVSGEARAKAVESDEVIFSDQPVSFETSGTLHDITFKVASPNEVTSNHLTLTPSGLSEINSPITVAIDGIVTGAEVADINADGSPEVYVFTRDATNHAGLIAYSANKKKSLSQIFLPELGEHAKGYRSGDEFAVVEGVIARRFPIYTEDPKKSESSGKMRQIQYKLHAGEAGWILKPDRVIEF